MPAIGTDNPRGVESRSGVRLLSLAMRDFAEATSDYPRLLETIVKAVAGAVGDACIMLLLSEDKQSLEPVAAYDSDPVVTRQLLAIFDRPLAMSEATLARDVMLSGEPACIEPLDLERFRAQTTPASYEFHRRVGTTGLVVVPLRVRGEPVGSFSVIRHRAGRIPLDAFDVEIAHDLANHAALAISNARLLRRAQDELGRRERAEAALEVSEALRRVEEDLVRAKEATDAANRELEAFSYSVAHDLRAPLRAIDGFSQALVEDYADKLDEQGLRYLRRVRDSAQHMAQLIDGLLTLSRLTRAEIRREEVDLGALARASLERLGRAEPHRRVSVVVEEGLFTTGDARLLAVVLDNLLGNAWKFTSKREDAHIEVGSIRGETGTSFFVRDDGAGFAMEYASRLFGAFQRLHGVAEFEGTGIGLATVQRVVARHGGRVWAEGAVNAGATFHFTLAEKERAS